MAVAKRQGREKPAKTEQRKVQDWSEALRQNRALLLAQFSQGRPRGEEKKYNKKRSQRAGGLSLSFSLSLSHSYLPATPGACRDTLLFLSLGRRALRPPGWIFLIFSKQNRAVTWSCNTDWSKSYNTVCSRPESYNKVCPRPESCDMPRGL